MELANSQSIDQSQSSLQLLKNRHKATIFHIGRLKLHSSVLANVQKVKPIDDASIFISPTKLDQHQNADQFQNVHCTPHSVVLQNCPAPWKEYPILGLENISGSVNIGIHSTIKKVLQESLPQSAVDAVDISINHTQCTTFYHSKTGKKLNQHY